MHASPSEQRRSTIPIIIPRLSLALLLGLSMPAHATEVQVGFDAPGDPIPLRLSQGCNGWTHVGWSQYFNDLGVEYRRADHWNDLYNPVRRRPDGTLWYDLTALDSALYNATGGYSFNIYPTVDFCPMCMDTDFLQNPLEFARATLNASLTPAGTLMISGQPRPTGFMLLGASNESGLYELDRKGVVISKSPYQQLQFVTAANHVVLKTADGYSILGADRKEITHGTGTVLQEFEGSSLLISTPSPVRDTPPVLSQVDLKGNVIQTFDGTFTGGVYLVKAGLLSYEHATNELFLTDSSGKHSLQKFPDNAWFGAGFASNPQDNEGRFYVVISLSPGPGLGPDKGAVYAFSSKGDLLWKTDPFPAQDLRGIAATRDGSSVVLGSALQLLGITQKGIAWKTDVRGALDFQMLSSQGMETVVMRTFEDEIDEYDMRTGNPMWRYGEDSDASYWVCKPPKNLDEWQESMAYYLKHYNKDLGLGWDRWELWNEPSEHGYFWDGLWQDYAALLESTMKAVVKVDPSITMDAYDGGNWDRSLIGYCNDHQVRLDAISWHGYLSGDGDYDRDELNRLRDHNVVASTYTGGKALQLSNTEWNVHPGHGEDLSHTYAAGYYRAPFQSEMIYLMGKNNVKFTAIFCMVSDMSWPAGWMFTSSKPVGEKTPEAGGTLSIVAPGYNATRLWAMLPKREAPVTNDFAPQGDTNGWSSHVNSIAASDPQKGEYGMLVWNYSNNAAGAKDEDVNLTFNFKGESKLYMHHFIIDQDHSTYTKDWDHQWLEATESVAKSASDLAKQTVTLKKDSLHGFFFTRDPMKANAGKSMTVEAHHPVRFDGSLSTGMPAYYRWDVDAADGVDFPDPQDGPPSRSHMFGVKPVLAQGYDKPGTYTVTLRVSADGYHKVTDTATTTVTVLAEKTVPETPQNLMANCVKTDHQVFLQWDALNFARNPDVAGWTVYRKQGTSDWTKAGTASTTSYIDSGVTEKIPYSYRVAAVDSSGNEGLPSKEVATVFQINHEAPKTPVALKAVNVADDRIQLDWDNDNLADAACVKGFNVYRRTIGSGDWKKLTETPIWYKRFYDDISNPGMAGRYEYAVSAVDAFKNESLQSDAVTPVPK